jgi:hypothetical protein
VLNAATCGLSTQAPAFGKLQHFAMKVSFLEFWLTFAMSMQSALRHEN